MTDEEQQTTGEQNQAESEGGVAGDQTLPDMDVWGVLQYCFILLHSQAWQAMGLVPDPATHTIKRDLEQARVAIDTASFIVSQLEPKLESKEQRNLRAMLSDLQINFVNQQKQG